MPRGDVLGEYDTYDDAQKVVDRLAKAEFAIKGLAIVGSDLTTVERVTGRLSYGRAALTGAGSGAWLGLFVGLVLFLFSPAPDFSIILAAALIGAGFGMTFGIASYAINRRRRDFSSTYQVLAGSYRIVIDPNQTARARQVLSGTTWPPADAGPVDAGPTDVGRVDAGSTDVGRVDAGSADAGVLDAGSTDATPADAPPGANADASPDATPGVGNASDR